MQSSKLPVSLVWKLLSKIFEDLDLSKLDEDYFNNNLSPESSYELIYGLLLHLLGASKPLTRGVVHGRSEDARWYSLDKTIKFNTLADCEVYGKASKFVWYCHEHAIFLKAILICECHCSEKYKKSLSKYRLTLEHRFNFRFGSLILDAEELLNYLRKNFDIDSCEFSTNSLMKKHESLYKNLCMLSYLVLDCEVKNTSSDGVVNVDYDNLDWLITQQYGVREIWRNINNIKSLTGKKHYKYEPALSTGRGGTLYPDAIYYFDDVDLQDIIVDIKLYKGASVRQSGIYAYHHNFYQVHSYTCAYPSYINSTNVGKKSRKVINSSDVNAWILHFRVGVNEVEKTINGVDLFDFSSVRVFNIDIDENRGVDYLDAQIRGFVTKYLI